MCTHFLVSLEPYFQRAQMAETDRGVVVLSSSGSFVHVTAYSSYLKKGIF